MHFHQWHDYGVIHKTTIISNAKLDFTIATDSSRRLKQIYHLYTSELRSKRYAQDKTSCGPSGTHTRPRGDTLPHRMPRVCDTSSSKETHHRPIRSRCADPRANIPHENELETPHTYPYTPWGSPSTHPDERRCKLSRKGFDRTPNSAEPFVT
jgi:hypothetical protein